MTTLRAEFSAAFLKTSWASPIWAKVNECVPIFSAGMRPLATIFSRVGMDTRSRRTLCLAGHSGAAHRCHFPRYQR